MGHCRAAAGEGGHQRRDRVVRCRRAALCRGPPVGAHCNLPGLALATEGGPKGPFARWRGSCAGTLLASIQLLPTWTFLAQSSRGASGIPPWSVSNGHLRRRGFSSSWPRFFWVGLVSRRRSGCFSGLAGRPSTTCLSCQVSFWELLFSPWLWQEAGCDGSAAFLRLQQPYSFGLQWATTWVRNRHFAPCPYGVLSDILRNSSVLSPVSCTPRRRGCRPPGARAHPRWWLLRSLWHSCRCLRALRPDRVGEELLYTIGAGDAVHLAKRTWAWASATRRSALPLRNRTAVIILNRLGTPGFPGLPRRWSSWSLPPRRLTLSMRESMGVRDEAATEDRFFIHLCAPGNPSQGEWRPGPPWARQS